MAEQPPTQPNNRALFWALIAVAASLLVVAIVLIIMMTRGGDADPVEPSPSPSPSPSVTPSPTPTPTPTPSLTPEPEPEPEPEPAPAPDPAPAPQPDPGPSLSALGGPSTVTCASESDFQEVTISWTSSGATQAWIGVNTSNAKNAPYDSVPTSGSATMPFPCSNSSQSYTVTVEDADGNLKHRTLTVQRSLS